MKFYWNDFDKVYYFKYFNLNLYNLSIFCWIDWEWMIEWDYCVIVMEVYLVRWFVVELVVGGFCFYFIWIIKVYYIMLDN